MNINCKMYQQIYEKNIKMLINYLLQLIIQYILIHKFLNPKDNIIKEKIYQFGLKKVDLVISKIELAINDLIKSKKNTLKFSLRKLFFENEMIDLFSFNIRNNYEIQSLMPELEIELTKKDFQHFITILSYNFLTNNQQDQLFIHDYHIYSKFNPIEIRAILYFENFKLKIVDSGITFQLFQLKVQKKQQIYTVRNQLQTNLISFQLEAKMMKIIKKKSCSSFINLTKAQLRLNLGRNKDNKLQVLNVKQAISYHQIQKNSLLISKILFFLHIAEHYLNILNFIDLDENSFPPEDLIIKKKQVTMINWKGIIAYPNENSKDILVSRGGINYILEKNKNKTSQKLTITNLEVFLCPENEILEYYFCDVVKRHIILPMYAFVGLNEKESQQQLDFSIENLNIQVSYKDFTPIYASYLFQKKQLELQKPIKQNKQQEEKLLLANVQVHQADIVFVPFIESSVPLIQFIIKDYQLSVTKRRNKLCFKHNFSIQKLVLGNLSLSRDHSKDIQGNPQIFTSIVVNESSESPMNVNFTKQNIKQLIELHKRWEQSIQNIYKNVQIKQHSPSRISKNNSIAQSAIEKVVCMSPYIVDNQTGYEIELTIINKTYKNIDTAIVAAYQQLGLKYAEQMEKSVLSIFKQIIYTFREIRMNQDRLNTRYECSIKQPKFQSELKLQINKKILTISSDILFLNNSKSDIELKLINKITQQQLILIVLKNDKKYIPKGYEQSKILVRYSNDGVWSQGMDLQKLILKIGNYNLFINTPCLVLRVKQPALTTQPFKLKFVCPFAIKNLLLLPIDIYFCIEDYCRIEPNQALNISNSQLNKGLKLKIKLPGFQKSQQIELNEQFKQQDFIIRDFLGLELSLQLIPLYEGEGLITIGVDGGFTVQNSLGLDIFYNLNQQREDGCLQFFNSVDNLIITFEQCNQEQIPDKISQPIYTKINGQFLVQIPKENDYMDIIIDVQTIVVHNISQKKIIQTTNCNCQQTKNKSNHIQGSLPDAKSPYFWRKIQGSKYLKFKLKDLSSGSISAKMQGTLNLPLRNSKVLTVWKRIRFKYIIVIESTQKPLYKIINQLNYDICFYQTEIQELNGYIKTNLPIGGIVDYSLDNPGYTRMINLEIYKNRQFSNFVKVELVNSDQTSQYKMADDEIFYLNTSFSLDQRQMIVTISTSEQHNKKLNYDNILNQFSVIIPKLNISIINSYPRDELLAISIQKIEFIQLVGILETIQIKLQDLQIDNNQHFRCTYPVLVTQQNEKLNILFMNALLKRALQINFINYFETVKLAIHPISLRIIEGIFCELESYLKSLEWIEEQKRKQLRVWQKDKSLKQQLCFFDNLQYFPFQLKLSFQQQYLKLAASQAINCDEVSITIKGYSMTNCYTTWDQLMLSSQIYISQQVQLILLGNPIGLIENVQEGFQDLFEMPYNGFVKGPLEGGLGIVKGVGSLTKGVVAGAFNSIAKYLEVQFQAYHNYQQMMTIFITHLLTRTPLQAWNSQFGYRPQFQQCP
ncbi:unnamed protein product [Paramecium pentaurelia]|uniref:Vacuolar protein sorting-associated protein 13 DH-like domain-containing protein n=1 Tax=Paramecium pentaurelia TaxID=43138 RepID=A0A8S1YQZ4_9CILI|nr:unnamed protein product [Paramecium pentaurelia]